MKKYSFLLFIIISMFLLLIYVLFNAARKIDVVAYIPQITIEKV